MPIYDIGQMIPNTAEPWGDSCINVFLNNKSIITLIFPREFIDDYFKEDPKKLEKELLDDDKLLLKRLISLALDSKSVGEKLRGGERARLGVDSTKWEKIKEKRVEKEEFEFSIGSKIIDYPGRNNQA